MSTGREHVRHRRWLARLYDWEAAHFLHDQLRDVPWILQTTRPGDRLLEVGCGTGRVALRLAAAGRTVFGLDIDEAMLERAVARAFTLDRRTRDAIEFACEDMRDFDLGQKFDCVLVPYNTMQLLDGSAERVSALVAMARHLVPGGRLVLWTHRFALEAEEREHVLTDYLDDESHVVAMYEATVVESPVHVRFVTDYEVFAPEATLVRELRGELLIEQVAPERIAEELALTGYHVESLTGEGTESPEARGPVVTDARWHG